MTPSPGRSNRRSCRGARRCAPVMKWLGVTLLFIAITAPAIRHGRIAHAETPPVVGVDLDTAGNSATSLGPIDGCTRVHAGTQFDIDLYVKNVPPIDGVQVTLQFDPAILRPVGYDTNLFLNSAPGSNVTRLEKPDAAAGTYVVAGFDLGQDSAEAGSGAAIRITFEALGAGSSNLQATQFLMIDASGAPVQPADAAGGFFAGTVTGGVVGVDATCDAGSAPTAQPGRTPAPTPEPSSDASTAAAVADTATAISHGVAPTSASGATPVAASSTASSPGAAAPSASAGSASAGAGSGRAASAQAGTPGTEPTFRSDTRPTSKTPPPSGQASAAGAQSDTSGGGLSSLPWLAIAVGVVALAGAAAFAWRRFGRT
jgi:cohesin domain-containing protein